MARTFHAQNRIDRAIKRTFNFKRYEQAKVEAREALRQFFSESDYREV